MKRENEQTYYLMVLANTPQTSAANSLQTLIYQQQMDGSQSRVTARDSSLCLVFSLSRHYNEQVLKKL